MASAILNIELPEDLYHEFITIVTEKKGSWRGQESFTEAINSAATAAFLLFLQDLETDTNLPKLRDYAREKYPEMDEELIKRKKQSFHH